MSYDNMTVICDCDLYNLIYNIILTFSLKFTK